MSPFTRRVVLASLLVTAWSERAWAQPARGTLHVLRLRAPDGDDEVAIGFTSALMVAARNAGYLVPDNIPGFDEEFARLPCPDTGPRCLAAIAQDLDATTLLYGAVHRMGRGHEAQLSIELAWWDNPSRRELHHETATMPRANTTADGYRLQAQRMFAAMTRPVVETPQPPVETPRPTVIEHLQAPRLPASMTTQGPGAAPWIVVGAGAALLASSAVLLALRNDAVDEWHAACGGQADCPESARPLYDHADSLNSWTAVTAIAGGVVVAGGLVWFFAAPRRSVPRASLAPHGGVVAGGGWVGAGGTF